MTGVQTCALPISILRISAFILLQVDDEWQTEIIRDPAVIRAYVRARLLIEEEATLADNLAPTGDADTDKRYKKRYALLSPIIPYLTPCWLRCTDQVGRADCEDEEEPGTALAPQERKDCKGRGYPNAAQQATETRHDGNGPVLFRRATCSPPAFYSGAADTADRWGT